MTILQAIIFGIIEGITEFLPISSTGHLTIAEKLMGFSIDDAGVTAFTAIIQTGAVLATVIYFRGQIWQILKAWFAGLFNASSRKSADYRYGWAIIIGSIPIGIVGFVFKDQIESVLRNLWFVALALLLWSGVMWLADRTAKQQRGEKDITWKDTLFIGVAQCLALIPGVSRSGATMSAGLFKGFDRVTVTKLSFFLSIPALFAAGAMQAITESDQIAASVGWTATIVATIVSFFVAYVTVSWLLKYVARHSYSLFIIYRVAIAVLLMVLLISGAVAAT